MLPSPPSRDVGSGPAPTRRSVLLAVGGLSVALASGCDLLDGDSPAKPAADPSRDLLTEVADATAPVAALVAATGARHPRLAPAIEGLRLAHAEHLRVLGALGSPSAPPSPPEQRVPGRPARALRALRRAETAHLALLLDAARSSADGPSARLLASMGAGLAQQLALLPEELS